MGRLQFLHWGSEKKLAKKGKNAAEDLGDVIDQVIELEKRIPEEINKGEIEKTQQDILKILNKLLGGIDDIKTLDKNSAIIDYELLKDIGEIERKVREIEAKKKEEQNLEETIRTLKDLTTKIQGLINKSRIDARNAKNDKEKILRYRTFIGFHAVIRIIRGLENFTRSKTGDKNKIKSGIISNEK